MEPALDPAFAFTVAAIASPVWFITVLRQNRGAGKKEEDEL